MERGHRYLKMFDMDRFADRLAGQLSGGMKQKLSLVCALVPQPHVLLLDEPTTGVDPVSRREFWDVLAHLAADGLTILVATPYLDEAERCHRVALMHLGELQQIGTPAELRSTAARKAAGTAHRETGRSRNKFCARSSGPRQRNLSTCSDSATGSTCSRTIRKRRNAFSRRAWTPPDSRSTTFASTTRHSKTRLSPHCAAWARRCTTRPFPGATSHQSLRGQIAIGAKNLTKQFGTFTAVKNVSLEVHYGEIYGLLGANGAGKTTTIKMLCGLLDPTQGQMQLAGAHGAQVCARKRVRQHIGYMSQKFSLYDDLTIRENLEFFAGVYGVPENERDEKWHWVLSFSGLEGKQDQITGSLPGGWKQRVAFGAAIMHEPSVLFLDEPTSGVDPAGAPRVLDHDQPPRRRGHRHSGDHALSGGSRAVQSPGLDGGRRIGGRGQPQRHQEPPDGTPARVRVDQPQRAADLSESRRRALARFAVRRPAARHHRRRRGESQGERRPRQLEANGIRVLDAHEGRFSLEDVFISVVEKARQQGKFVDRGLKEQR